MENPYRKHFTEKSLWQKTGDFAQAAGQQVIYAVLLLYYMFNDPAVSIRKKVTIGAALGYFIFPADAIPDITPLIGYSDDLGVLLFALTQIYSTITPEIKDKARRKMKDWFPKVSEKELLALEEKMQRNPQETK